MTRFATATSSASWAFASKSEPTLSFLAHASSDSVAQFRSWQIRLETAQAFRTLPLAATAEMRSRANHNLHRRLPTGEACLSGEGCTLFRIAQKSRIP